MLMRRTFLAPLALAALMLVRPAGAAELKAFDPAAFSQAAAGEQPVLVSIHADWCPTCKAQAPILHDLLTGKFAAMQAFTVDFDSQKEVVRQFGARMQSTLIVYKGKTEVGRSVGDTDAGSIEALLAKAQ